MTPRKVVCNCHAITEAAIHKEIQAGADFARLQNTLKCGTSCGSCIPELKRMLGTQPTAAHAAGPQYAPA